MTRISAYIELSGWTRPRLAVADEDDKVHCRSVITLMGGGGSSYEPAL